MRTLWRPNTHSTSFCNILQKYNAWRIPRRNQPVPFFNIFNPTSTNRCVQNESRFWVWVLLSPNKHSRFACIKHLSISWHHCHCISHALPLPPWYVAEEEGVAHLKVGLTCVVSYSYPRLYRLSLKDKIFITFLVYFSRHRKPRVRFMLNHSADSGQIWPLSVRWIASCYASLCWSLSTSCRVESIWAPVPEWMCRFWVKPPELLASRPVVFR